MATWLLLVLSLLGWKALSVAQDQNSHQSFKVTWKLQNGETYEVLNQTTATHPVNTLGPDLYFHQVPIYSSASGPLSERKYRAGYTPMIESVLGP